MCNVFVLIVDITAECSLAYMELNHVIPPRGIKGPYFCLCDAVTILAQVAQLRAMERQ